MVYVHLIVVVLLTASLLGGCVFPPPEDADSQAAEELRARMAEQTQTIAELKDTLEEAKEEIIRQSETIASLEAGRERTEQRVRQQQETIGELRAAMEAGGPKSINHEGLFYDEQHIALVKENLDKPPWRLAIQVLQSKADDYLDLTPQPIRGEWFVPSPFEAPLAQDEAVRPLEESTNAMIVLAQFYLFSGDEKYARKAAQIANAWTGSLMNLANEQALYQAGWEMLVMAMAAGMLDDYPGWESGEKRAFQDWLNERTWYIIARNDSLNNHQYWMAAQAAAVGIASNDPGLLKWAVAVYRKAIAADILADGHMPQETARGELGMFYQNFALAALVLVAEMAEHQGIDLWSYSFKDKDLKLAIDYLFNFLDAAQEWPWSEKPQDMGFLDPGQEGKKIGWFEIAYQHYRDPIIAQHLSRQRPIFSRRTGGMTTLTHGLLLE